ncbi:MAG: amidohydrolase [Planctomycetota bacterium]
MPIALALWCLQDAASADLVVYGRLFTADEARPRAEALAVRGERIVRVGDRAEVEPLVGPETRVIDAGDSSVVPGFNDAHCHFTVGYGIPPDLDLSGASSLEELQELLRRHVEAHPDDDVIHGHGWDLADLPGERYPTRRMLDEVVGDRAAVLWSEGPHGVWCSTEALERAGLDSDWEPSPTTIALRDPETGELSGTILGRGLLFLFPFLRRPDLGELRMGIAHGQRDALSFGVTSVQESVSPLIVPYLAHLYDEGELLLRLHVWGSLFRGGANGAEAQLKAAEKYARGDWLTFGALKGGVDGMPGLRTAALLAPYADDPATRGLLTLDEEELGRGIADANERGVAVTLHAAGDGGVRLCLDAVASVEPEARLRNRIEHAFAVEPGDWARFAELGVVASVQPGFLCTELAKGGYYARRFGEERSAHVLPLASLLDAGCTLAFGTDFSLTPIDPMVGLYGAVARRPLPSAGDAPAFVPDEAIDLGQALRAYTFGSAFAQGAEGAKGRLREGLLADLVVLSRDVFEAPLGELPEVRVLTTVVGGRVAYEAE